MFASSEICIDETSISVLHMFHAEEKFKSMKAGIIQEQFLL